MKQKRKSLSHDAYLKKLNNEMQKHPNYRQGMHVMNINANLYDMHIPGLDLSNPDDFAKFKKDIDLQMVLWDSVAVIDKTYSYTDKRVSEKMLPKGTLSRNSKEGRGSVQLQSRFKVLYDGIMDYRQEYKSWPIDTTQ